MSEFLFDINEEPEKKKIEIKKEKKKVVRKPRATFDFKKLEELTARQVSLLERQNHLLEQLLLKRSQEKIRVQTEKIEEIALKKEDEAPSEKSLEEKILNLLEKGRSFNFSELRKFLIKFGEDENKLTTNVLKKAVKNLKAKQLIVSRSDRLFLRSRFKLKITELIRDIIFLLKEKGEMKKKEIEVHFSKHPSTIYRNLKILEYEGYIGLKAPNRIYLTEKGQFLYEKCL
ncbi:MAG: hypothetical protein ACTSX4_06630 [Candidatus Helarchaeota archaeon]